MRLQRRPVGPQSTLLALPLNAPLLPLPLEQLGAGGRARRSRRWLRSRRWRRGCLARWTARRTVCRTVRWRRRRWWPLQGARACRQQLQRADARTATATATTSTSPRPAAPLSAAAATTTTTRCCCCCSSCHGLGRSAVRLSVGCSRAAHSERRGGRGRGRSGRGGTGAALRTAGGRRRRCRRCRLRRCCGGARRMHAAHRASERVIASDGRAGAVAQWLRRRGVQRVGGVACWRGRPGRHRHACVAGRVRRPMRRGRRHRSRWPFGSGGRALGLEAHQSASSVGTLDDGARLEVGGRRRWRRRWGE